MEKVHEISVLRDEGKSQNKIAEITGVPLSTVGKICARLGKTETKEEPAPSANDTSSKEISTTNIVPEIPANVNPCDKVSGENFCCEVTGDTDMEAYLADREKFLAAKGHRLPTIVWEACMEKMENLNGKIITAQSDIKTWTDEIKEIAAFLAESTHKKEMA